jgi:cytochrome b
VSNKIYVWDLFVRIFHWSLVVLFVTSYLTGEEEHWIHVYSGYVILVLLALRVLWGFIGPKSARFSDFMYSPGKVIGYLKSLVSGDTSERYIGHNPAGGMMVLAMFVTLTCIGFSGLKLYAIEEGKGPLAGDVSFATFSHAYADSDDEEEDYDHHDDHEDEDEDEDEEAEEYWEDIHEASVNFMLLLIILHVVGVFLSSRRHDESLVKGMLTGYKQAN